MGWDGKYLQKNKFLIGWKKYKNFILDKERLAWRNAALIADLLQIPIDNSFFELQIEDLDAYSRLEEK